MEIPKVGGNKYLLLTVDSSTGHIINKNGSLVFTNKKEDLHEVIEGKTNALYHAIEKVNKNHNIEISIYDGKGIYIDTIRHHG